MNKNPQDVNRTPIASTSSGVLEKYNFERHRRILAAWGAWHKAKEAYAAGRLTNDVALARGEALLAELADIAKLDEYETVTVSVGWAPTNQVSWSVWQKTGGRCTYCDIQLNPFDRFAPDGFQIDHVNPRSQGGSDELDNLTPACRACNLSKSARTPGEWRSSRG